MDTTDLVLYAKNGNQQAITALYNISYKPAYAVAFKMTGNEDDAFDVLQDAYMKAFSSLDQLTDPSGFIPWFNKITANKCRDFLRSKKNLVLFSDMTYDSGEDSLELEFEDENQAFQPEEHTDYNETKRLVAEMLDNLPADQKMVLLMYYVQEMSIKEIAEALDISENTVKSRMNYGKKKMRVQAEDLEKKGVKLRVSAVAIIPFLIWLLRDFTGKVAVRPMSAAVAAAPAAASGAARQTATQQAATRQTASQPAQPSQVSQSAWSNQAPAQTQPVSSVGKAAAKAAAKGASKGISAKVVALIIVGAVAVIAGATAFVGFALPAITGEPNFISNIINPGAGKSSKDSDNTAGNETSEKSTPQALVNDYETAYSKNDYDALRACYYVDPSDSVTEIALESRLKIIVQLNAARSAYEDPNIECEITDLKENGDTATCNVIVKSQSGESKIPAEMKKVDGKWYFTPEFLG